MAKMSRKSTNVPNLRFDFEGEWVESKIGQIISIKSDKYNPETDELEYTCIELESLSQGTGELLSTFNSKSQKSIKNVFRSGDVLFGKLRPYLRKYYLPHFEGVCSSEIWVMKSTILNSSYLYAFVQSNIFQALSEIASGSRMPRADWNLISETVINYPGEISEREKIGELFQIINTRISTQSKIIEELKLLKAEISKKVFTQQLRFKDDKGNNFGDWALKKLGEITVAVNKRNKNNEKLPVYSINNKLGFVPQDEQFEGIDSEERGYDITLYKIIDRHTFSYNPARINIGSIGYSGDLENIIISSLYVCFKTTSDVNDAFLFQYLKTDLFNKEVLKSVEGGVREYLFYENFSKIKLNLPCREEQMKIDAFLSTIDKKTEFETTILNLLAKQKQYLLQQMFI